MVKFELKKLPYEYNALEPYIDEETLQVHHDKHHQAYTDKFNVALETDSIDESDILKIFGNISKYSMAVRNNGGGYWNHQFYWESMTGSKTEVSGELLEMINRDFESFDKFKEHFSNSAATLFGSGWTWLCLSEGKLVIFNTPNQDNPYMDVVGGNAIPLLVIDVWEHAYYLKYQNKRPDYISNFFNVINWDKVSQRLEAAR